MREPLVWPGGTRLSASGLLVEIHTDEGIVGVGEAPGPTLPTIRTIIEAELTQFLVGQDPLRTEWLVHRMEEFTRNWSRMGAYAIAGLEIALLDLKGKALGRPGGGAARRLLPAPGARSSATSSSTSPRRTRARRRRSSRPATTELKLKVGRDFGQDHDTLAAIRDEVGPEVEDPDRREHDVERPGGDQVDPRARAFRPPVRRAAGARLRRAGARAGAALRRACRSPRTRACTDLRSALELIKADACDVFVVYPSEAGGLTRARQIAALADAAGKWCAIGSWAELGVATMANAQLVASSTNFPFASDTHYPLQEHDVLTEPLEMGDGFDRGLGRAGPRRRDRPRGGRTARQHSGARIRLLRRHRG